MSSSSEERCHTEERPDTVVVGIGNTLMRDEGIGPAVVEALGRSQRKPQSVDCVELGTGGLTLLHHIAGRRKAVIVDCALMGCQPGTFRAFEPEEARSIKRMTGFSLHEGDLLSVIRLARDLGEAPEQIVICGVEPHEVAPGEGLSDLLAQRLDEYLDSVLRLL